MGVGVIPATVARGWPSLNFAAGVKSDPNSMEVVAPATVGGITTITIDATVVAATPQLGLAYVFPVTDPAGCIITGFPYTTPYMTLDVPALTAPTANSGVSLLIGILDGPLVASDQFALGGLRYGSATGPNARTIDHNGVEDNSAAVAGGVFSEFELNTRSSVIAAGQVYVRFGASVVAVDKLGGTGLVATVSPNDEYANVPKIIVAITSTGASPDSAMQFSFDASALVHFKQAALGG